MARKQPPYACLCEYRVVKCRKHAIISLKTLHDMQMVAHGDLETRRDL